MIELMRKEEALSLEQTALLLGMSEIRLANLCHKIEAGGYVFQRTVTGAIHLTEEDLMMILCFT